MADDVKSKLDAAKSALGKANSFTKSVEGKNQSMFGPKPAPVSAAKTAAPAPVKAPPTLGDELRNKAANVRQYSDNVPKMHKGGTVKEDGVVELKKGETVRTPEQEKKVQEKLKKTPSAEKLLGGKKKASEGSKESKSDKKETKKKKHQFKRTIIDHHSDGTHTMTHEHESGDSTKNITGAKENLDGVHDGLEENIGEPEEGAAPPPAAPPAPAAPGNAGME